MMGNYYRQEDISSALSELMESPYANSDQFLYSLGVKDCLKLVKDMVDGNVSDSLKIPTADARENVRGIWNNACDFSNGNEDLECSVCGEWFFSYKIDCDWNYCPNCGADMREKGGKT